MIRSLVIGSLSALCLASPAAAAHTWSPAVKVDTLQISPNGDVLVTLLSSHDDVECGGSGTNLRRYWLKKAHLGYDAAVSFGLTAVASEADVYFRAGSCEGVIPVIEYFRID